jgi:3-deoxy-manno-octulosonate cytidylyltransferase (CMP-KDO synthetase)
MSNQACVKISRRLPDGLDAKLDSGVAMSLRVLAVIPARYASTRFPGKPLALISGKPMIQRVCDQVRQCRLVERVVVATDDVRIQAAVEAFGGEAIMTRSRHGSGTARMAEVAERMVAGIYVNVQGDEPLIAPEAISAAVEVLLADKSARVSTLCVPIGDLREVNDPNVVKVVCDARGNALYFSRAAIPVLRDASHEAAAGRGASPVYKKHLGLYAFRREALLEFASLTQGLLEQAEQLEQLRLLEHGIPIRVVETTYDSVSVDVPEDIARVEQVLRSQSVPRNDRPTSD